MLNVLAVGTEHEHVQCFAQTFCNMAFESAIPLYDFTEDLVSGCTCTGVLSLSLSLLLTMLLLLLPLLPLPTPFASAIPRGHPDDG